MRKLPLKKLLLIPVAGLLCLLVLAVLAIGLFQSRDRELFERHQPYSEPWQFDYASGSFNNYIDYARRRITAARVEPLAPDQLDKLSPSILMPEADCPLTEEGLYPNGIVITHGLFDSPYSMSDIAAYFHSQCFYVQVLLLPDHGTRPGDMLVTQWQQWVLAEHFATRTLAEKVRTVYVSGHSVGGALSVHEAATNPDVDALIAYAPALAISGAAKYAKFIALIGKLFPKAAWLDVKPDNASYRYESFTLASAAQTWELTRHVQEVLEQRPLTVPAFIIASMEETTVSAPAIVSLMESNRHGASRNLLYSRHSVEVADPIEVFISRDEDAGILSLSHLGLMTSPEHPEYGRNGNYRYCGHYRGDDDASYRACMNGQRDFYGEITDENRQRGVIERIAFNPYYAGLLQRMEQFIAEVSALQQ
ncbi:MAG: alpha/beta fold hydrolase [Pseudohongiellaceae bacterium]